MSKCSVVDLDENDRLYHTYLDYANCTLRLTQISIVAPQTIQKFKDAGWDVVEGVLMGRDGKPVPVEPPTFPLQSLASKVKEK